LGFQKENQIGAKNRTLSLKKVFHIKCGMTDAGFILTGGRFLDSAALRSKRHFPLEHHIGGNERSGE